MTNLLQHSKTFYRGCLLLLFISLSQITSANVLTAAQLNQDIDQWLAWVKATHPDLTYSVDEDALQDAMRDLRQQIPEQVPSHQAWRYLSLLNPILNDGHMGVRAATDDFVTFQQAGGYAFPVQIEVTDEGQLALAQTYLNVPAKTVILAINQVPTHDIVAALMQRMRGDSPALRQQLIERRFAQYYFALFGAAKTYQLQMQNGTSLSFTSEDSVSDVDMQPRDPMFALSFAEDNTALLRIDSFAIEHKQDFEAFLRDSFADITKQQSSKLIIDLRDNGGGAHDLSDQLINFLTTEKVTPISKVTARVVPENQQLLAGANLGQVVSTPYARWYQPDAELPHRFTGEVTVLIGPYTYSQAIVFATQVQDFKLGTLAGQPTGGRANQTAQVQRLTLTHSGLEVLAPIYIMTRASGDASDNVLTPDIMVPVQINDIADVSAWLGRDRG